MRRIVKEHEERRKEILDVAQQLFYTRGYTNTSVANVIDAVGIAKGTFYHYFESKAELLDQIIDRQSQAIDRIIDRVLEEPEENAIVELNNVFEAIGEYKAENKEVMLMMLRSLYSEENFVMRMKLTKMRIKVVAPRLARIISRGNAEGFFNIEKPEYISEMILNMTFYLSDETAHLLLSNESRAENKKMLMEKCKLFDEAIERILGAPKNSISFCNRKTIDSFFEG